MASHSTDLKTIPSPDFRASVSAFLRAPGLWCCLGFFVFNFILFLPFYLLNYQDTSFAPRPAGIDALLSSRANPDIFRLNLEISLFILLWVLIRPLQRKRARHWLASAFSLLFFVVLIYQIYESITLSFFHTSPIFYNDYAFFIHGIGFLVDGLRVNARQGVLGGALVIGLLWGVYKLIIAYFTRIPVQQMGRLARGLAVLLLIWLVAYAVLWDGRLSRAENAISSTTAKLSANIQASRTKRDELRAYEDLKPESVYTYAETTHLLKKPNVYLIFVESYGSVLYKRRYFRGAYTELLDEMDARLQNAGWAAETALSTSPTWGGGSWMAYTSAEFGVHIESQPAFLAISDKYAEQPYPSLGRYFQSQGYRHIRLSPIPRNLNQKEQKVNSALYGPDRWITFADLDYRGPRYGWGPSPPDQFSLHKARKLLQLESDAPFFFTTLTQNSHYPWAPLPQFNDDWQALNNPQLPQPDPIGEPIPHRDTIKHYSDAVRYQWQTLSAFILDTPATENAIFILIGDHQPPRVSRKDDGYETPIHIIARDPEFVRRFETYGFEPGLIVSDTQPDMTHEGLYSLLVRELMSAFGTSTQPPPYLSSGIDLDIPAHTHTD